MSDYEGEEVPPAPPVRFIDVDRMQDVVSSSSSTHGRKIEGDEAPKSEKKLAPPSTAILADWNFPLKIILSNLWEYKWRHKKFITFTLKIYIFVRDGISFRRGL